MSNIDSEYYSKLLGKQIGIWEEIISLALEKQQVLLEGDVIRLNEVVAREEMLIRDAGYLEQQRFEAFAKLAGSLNLPITSTLKEIVARCPKELGDTLEQSGTVLTGLLERMKGINSQNVSLIQQSLDLIQFTMESLVVSRQPPTYNPQDKKQKTNTSFLVDAKI